MKTRKQEVLLRLILILVFLPLLVLLHHWKGECTCEDQIPDQQLSSITLKKDTSVQQYLNTRDNAIMCQARRKELLLRLEQKKKVKANPPIYHN